jgi:hypothetical protein
MGSLLPGLRREFGVGDSGKRERVPGEVGAYVVVSGGRAAFGAVGLGDS